MTTTEAFTYTPQQQLEQTIFDSAGGTSVGYGYSSTTGDETSQTVSPPGEQAPVQTDYGYDPVSERLQTVQVNGQTFTYTYQANSNQIASVTVGNVTIDYTPYSSDGALTGRITAVNDANGQTLFDERITGYNQ